MKIKFEKQFGKGVDPWYAKVCADVMLINPPGVVANHTHEIKTKPPISNDASLLKTKSIGNTKK